MTINGYRLKGLHVLSYLKTYFFFAIDAQHWHILTRNYEVIFNPYII